MPSKIILYGSHASPATRAVHMTLEALGLDFEFKQINVYGGENLTEEFLKKNPQHTIPTLEDIDGKCIWDSHAIMPYLARKYGKDDSLYPKDFYKRAVVDQRLHFETGVLSASLIKVTLGQLRKGGVTKEGLAEIIKTINETYDLLEKFIGDNNFIAGENLTIADFSIVTTTPVLTLLAQIDAAKNPKLSAWYDRVQKLPYYDLVNAEGLEKLAARFNEIKQSNEILLK